MKKKHLKQRIRAQRSLLTKLVVAHDERTETMTMELSSLQIALRVANDKLPASHNAGVERGQRDVLDSLLKTARDEKGAAADETHREHASYLVAFLERQTEAILAK